MNRIASLIWLAFQIQYSLGSVQLAILHLQGESGSADICAVYNPYYAAIPTTVEKTEKLTVLFPKDETGCSDYTENAMEVSSFISTEGNCSHFQKLQKAYSAHAKQVILLSKTGNTDDLPKGTAQEHKQIHLSVGLIRNSTLSAIEKVIGAPLQAQLYHPHDPVFDPNLVVIWVIATFTVVVGAYWCGLVFERSEIEAEKLEKNGGIPNEDDEMGEFPITTIMIVVFIVLICTTLLLLYFFYKYLIYVVIGLFAIASVTGTFTCLSALMSLVNCGRCRIPENNLPLFNERFEIREIILLLLCVGLSAFWVVIRNESYAWILQDFLGVCFCISLIKTIRLPNLKISAILLIALLLYDIFFVFITPFFSARGKSVMVEVATGNGSKEQLPMVIRIPKIVKTALSICERPYSLLGFGDILLPGLFVAFNHNFDVLAKTKYKVYFLATSIGYGIGLGITFVALILMKEGQPALLYLAPSVLIACTFVGYIRGELKNLWRGRIDIPYPEHNEEGNIPAGESSAPNNEQQNLLSSDNTQQNYSN